MREKNQEAVEQEEASVNGAQDRNAQSLEPRDMTLFETIQSVLWAMLGVQKSKNAKRDFSKGKASHFIIIGIAFGVIFVVTLIFIVRAILSSAGVQI